MGRFGEVLGVILVIVVVATGDELVKTWLYLLSRSPVKNYELR